MDEYYEVTSDLDAREILRYLNHLGIHNISGEVLKCFITDLKKLIKYDLKQKKEKENNVEQQGPERLYSATTFASRNRSKSKGIVYCSRECRKSRNPLTIRNVHSAPSLAVKTVTEDKPLRRACSCIREPRKPEISSKESKVTTTTTSLIKVPIQAAKKKCDPVALYHYYTSLWAKYKSNLPGENDWADLRWNIRQKMAGVTQQPVHKVPELNLKPRDAWID